MTAQRSTGSKKRPSPREAVRGPTSQVVLRTHFFLQILVNPEAGENASHIPSP